MNDLSVYSLGYGGLFRGLGSPGQGEPVSLCVAKLGMVNSHNETNILGMFFCGFFLLR